MTMPTVVDTHDPVPDLDLSERDVRASLLSDLYSRLTESEIVEEFPAAGGRVDVLAISASSLKGFEIKSDFDTLDRVENQTVAFSRYVDTLTFVAGRRHALTLLRRLPVWCGVKLAYRSGSTVQLVELRECRENPLLDLRSRLSLLWREELLAISGTSISSLDRRADLRDKLVGSYTFEELRSRVSSLLKQRRLSVEPQTSRDGLSPPGATCSGSLFARLDRQ